MYACLGATCHLHFWQNDRGVLCATAVTRGWNGRRLKVSTQNLLWRKKFSRRFCQDSNSQPFDHESGDLTNKLSRLPSVSNWILTSCQPHWVTVERLLQLEKRIGLDIRNYTFIWSCRLVRSFYLVSSHHLPPPTPIPCLHPHLRPQKRKKKLLKKYEWFDN